ncbi:Chemotaxis protein MotB [Chromobacterium violaceum]|uniref:Chemotaxis protein MotB n=1 Tax=Chromobacterium violaceum TaxID=536 RepID=A0A3S4I6S6_CHRVL|nr:Chemotaxis protein MotB [Chromobacterium violaceum]
MNGISEYFKTPLKVALSGGAGAGDATSVIKGGGNDITKQAGQVNKAGAKQEEVMQKQKEQARLNQLQQKIQQTIDQSELFKQYKNQLKLEMTPEGLKIQIVDEQNRPMFDSGSSRMLPHTRVLLQQLAPELNQLPNRISISGHTDAKPFGGGQGGYSNWELSADRANTARRELVAGGLTENKILRVVGLASANPLIKSDVFSPENRRITIVVLNKDTESSILNDGFKPQMNQDVIGGPSEGAARPRRSRASPERMKRLRHPLLQLSACACAWVFVAPALHLLPWAALQGLFAGLFAILLRLPSWQRIAHGLFVPAAALASQAGIAPGWYLAALLLTLALGRNALVERVPLYRSAALVAERLAERLAGDASLLEAGCGDGRLALQLSQRRPDLRMRALENAVGSWLLARWRWLRAGKPSQLAFACRNFWNEDWGGMTRSTCSCRRNPCPGSGASSSPRPAREPAHQQHFSRARRRAG